MVGNSISPSVLPNPTRQRVPMTVNGDKRVNDSCCIWRSRYPSRSSAKGLWIRESKEACIVLSCFVGSNDQSCQRSSIDDDRARESTGRMIEPLLRCPSPRCIRGMRRTPITLFPTTSQPPRAQLASCTLPSLSPRQRSAGDPFACDEGRDKPSMPFGTVRRLPFSFSRLSLTRFTDALSSFSLLRRW